MNDITDLSGVTSSKRAVSVSTGPARGWHEEAEPGPEFNGHSARAAGNGEAGSGLEAWTFIELVVRRWYWIFLSGCFLTIAGVYAGQMLFKPTYSATVKLLRNDTQNGSEFYKPRQFSEQTYSSLLRAPELLESVGRKARPPLSASALNRLLVVTPMRESEVVMAVLPGATREAAVDLANLYGEEAVRFMQNLQAREAGEVNNALKQQLAHMDADVKSAGEQLRSLPRSALLQPALPGSTLEDKLQLAREELYNLLAKYTDEHPLVKEQRARIAAIEKQIAESARKPMGQSALTPQAHGSLPMTGRSPISSTNIAGLKGAMSGPTFQSDLLLSEMQILNAARLTLSSRQREAQQYAEKPPGYAKILAPANPAEVQVKSAKPKVILLGVLGFVLGIGGSLMLVMLTELLDDRLKTRDDVKRVTRLPLIASLSDLNRMTASTQSHWAFRTWTALQSRLSLSPNHGLVCGFTSSCAGEGRSTWVNLLAQAASECGFRVLTIATVPTIDTSSETDPNATDENATAQATAVDAEEDFGGSSLSTALTTSVLSSPMLVTQKLTGKDPQPYVHIPLPGWVWNLERRKQWQSALNQWSKIDNIVILVELPPASTPEAILLAENLPNLVWLADSRKAHASACREQLETLREARCHLVGSALNHEPKPPLKKRFARWVPGWMWLAGASLLLGVDGFAQTFSPAPPITEPIIVEAQSTNVVVREFVLPPAQSTNASFSVTGSSQRAPWQERFVLGPGDILNFALFGQPELSRTEVLIGPDGKVSYLQAIDVQASGLTIDELRNRLDERLSKYYQAPRSIITPVAFNSKKYYVLGKVAKRGVFTLNQPITIIEAVARAQGLETGLVDFQNSVDLADLQRSFLARQGKRVPVDFEKLFQNGDLSQNIAIEPDDYLYFASANLKEVYVLGEVNSPGVVTLTGNTTVISAISSRLGFTDKAYKGRVLVIRGSLQRPQTFVIDVWGALEAKSMNFKLESKDIVYVSHRPFIRAEELLDLAATAFIQSAVSAWTVPNVGPLFNSPILP